MSAFRVIPSSHGSRVRGQLDKWFSIWYIGGELFLRSAKMTHFAGYQGIQTVHVDSMVARETRLICRKLMPVDGLSW